MDYSTKPTVGDVGVLCSSVPTSEWDCDYAYYYNNIRCIYIIIGCVRRTIIITVSMYIM